MTPTRRTLALLLVEAGLFLAFGPLVRRVFALPAPPLAEGQDQAPNRRELTLTASNYRFSPSRLEVAQDDLIKLTVQSQDVAYSLTIDEYRLSKRVPAGGSTTLEFRADRAGTFPFYSNLSNDSRHAQMRGELVVRAR